MSNLFRLTFVTLSIICSMNGLSLAEEIQPWPENPWYWSYRGQPVLLLGGSDDDNLFQWPAEKLIPQLDRIAAAGGNVVRNTMTDLYQHLTRQRGFADRPVVLGRSRGGLWVSQWASRNVSKVAGLAGIYPVFDLTTYPGLETAAQAYELSVEQLQDSLEAHNPIAHVHRLAAAAVPVFLIDGAPDQVVPLEPNSATVQRLYEAAGNPAAIDLEVVPNQGHNYWPGFFRSKKLVDFVVRNALPEQPQQPIDKGG